MAAAKPRKLDTDEQVKAAVDELLGAFAAPPDAEPDDTGFEEDAPAPKPITDGDTRTTAPSADADALWGKPKKKK